MEGVLHGLDTRVALNRYRKGEWRDRIFRDMIFHDARPWGRRQTFLDIGCGSGFDGDVPLQKSVAEVAGTFVGVEPDTAVRPGDYFDHVHRCRFEDAPIPPGSVDVAYAIMVLEHLSEPRRFWDKVRDVLRPGGVFWGLTVDRRHWFCRCSLWFDRLRIKDAYLNLLLGKRGEKRYENYPVCYRSNSPRQIDALTPDFARRDYFNFSRVGQCSGYFPPPLRPLVNAWDALAIKTRRPGTLLAVRVQK
jgi:SAM-dependent methyltransferase